MDELTKKQVLREILNINEVAERISGLKDPNAKMFSEVLTCSCGVIKNALDKAKPIEVEARRRY